MKPRIFGAIGSRRVESRRSFAETTPPIIPHSRMKSFPLFEKQARNLDALLKALPYTKEFDCRKAGFLNPSTKLDLDDCSHGPGLPLRRPIATIKLFG